MRGRGSQADARIKWRAPVVAALAALAVAPATGAAPRLMAPDSLKQLVLDSRVIATAENARLALGTPEKDARNPLMPADRPWENSTNNLYPNVLWDEEERTFKLWYKDVLADKDAIARMDGPSTVHDVGWYLLYATSRDGLAWTKPALGLHRFGGDAATNIVARDTPNVGVFKDPRDPDPARRYKMVYDVGLGKLRTRFSRDGIHWGEPREVTGFGAQHGDTHNNAFWDERTGKYVWFTKLYLGERLVARFESDDFENWRGSGMVLRSGVEEGRSSQTYCLPVFPYANLYLGYAMIYNVGKGRTVDCELAWSPDGVQWRRVKPGTQFLPRGPAGSHDSQCIYAQAGPPVEHNGRLLIYYGGSDFPHTGWKRHCLLSLARLRLDGFAGYEPAEAERPAVLVTTPLLIERDRLTVSADAKGGRWRVEATDDAGRVLARSGWMQGESTDAEIPVAPALRVGARVRLRFELERARLYAFGGARLVNTAMPVNPPPPLPRHAARAQALRVDFDRDAAGWRGVDRLEHKPEGGAKGGFVSAMRAKKLNPIAIESNDPKLATLAGDWPVAIGGDTATVTWQLRSAQTGTVNLEIFAAETQWSFRVPHTAAPGWRAHTVMLRYDWSDAEAAAAGWQRAQSAFSWRDTIRHVGRLSFSFQPAEAATDPQGFDLDEVEVRGK